MEETLTIKIGLYKVPEGYRVNEGAFKFQGSKKLLLTLQKESSIVTQLSIHERDFYSVQIDPTFTDLEA